MENGHATEGAAVGLCLAVDGSRSLTIGEKHLVLDGTCRTLGP